MNDKVMYKNLDIQVKEIIKTYLASRVEDQAAQKFYLYSIVTPSTAIKGSTVTEIHSPGSLPNGLTIEDIKSGTSMPRNMFLFTNANYLLPYTGAGSGVRRALEYDPDVTFSNGVNDREITHYANEFVITIPRKSEQVTNQAQSEIDQVTHKTDPIGDQTSQHTTNLNINTDQVTDQPHSKTDQVTHRVKLSKKQLDIKNFCSIPRTAKEILERAGVTNHFYNRTKYIYELVEAGILERTIPDKPNDPNQKYRRKQ